MNPLLLPLQADSAVVLIVDLQDRLLPAIEDAQYRTAQALKLIEAAKLLQLPLVLTEQYPKGLGQTCTPIREALGHLAPIEKTRFTACVDATVARLRELNRKQVIVAGIETHVCVQQTVLDLLRLNYVPYVCADAVGSRRDTDYRVALHRMRQAGAIVSTVESVVFELLGQAGTDLFKQMLKLLK